MQYLSNHKCYRVDQPIFESSYEDIVSCKISVTSLALQKCGGLFDFSIFNTFISKPFEPQML